MKFIKNKIVMILTGMLLITGCFFCSSVKAEAHEQEFVYAIGTSGIGGVINNDNEPPAETGTGVDDLDEAGERGIRLLVGLTKIGGLACGIIGIVIAAIGYFGHQEDLKAKAPIFIFVGVIIYLAKEIFSFLVGK